MVSACPVWTVLIQWQQKMLLLLDFLNRAISPALILIGETSWVIFYSSCHWLYYYNFSRLSHGCSSHWGFFLAINNLWQICKLRCPPLHQGSPPAQIHHPQMAVRPWTLPQVVQANTSPHSQLLPSNFQSFGSQADVLGTWLPINLPFRFKATLGRGSIPYQFSLVAVLETIQVKKHLLFCNRSLWRLFKHPTCCTAELAILPETLFWRGLQC